MNRVIRLPATSQRALRRIVVALTLFMSIGMLGGCNAAGQAEGVADRHRYLVDVKQALRAIWPDNRRVMIVCHGHSVPSGYFKTPEVRSLDAYPNLLRVRLAERYRHAVINIVVTGVGGENAEEGARRFERDVLSLRPDVVTIDYALNDRALGLERANRAWRAMIEAALAQGVKLLLLTPTPDLEAQLDDPNDPLNQHASQIRALAAEYHVGLVDSLRLFTAAAGNGGLAPLMAQHNHPNAAGHGLIGEALFSWFE